MNKVSPTQLDAFRHMMVDSFVRRGVDYLREIAPDRTAGMSERQLERFVRDSIPRAARHGLSSEQAVICVAHIRLLTDDQFDRAPEWNWVVEILGDETAEQSLRAKLALEIVAAVHEDPEAIQAMSRDDADGNDEGAV